MAVRGSSTTFIGRRDELATLDRLLDDGARRLRLVLVGGETGIGKSRLIAEWARRARVGGATVLVGGAVETAIGASLPYAAIIEALRPLGDEAPGAASADGMEEIGPDLARLLPRLRRSAEAAGEDPGEAFAQARLFGQAADLLGRLGARAPSALVLEDLHWADASTLDLITFLARSLASARVGLVGSFRSDLLAADAPLRRVLARLATTPGTARLELAPLGAAEHAELVAQLTCGRATPAVVAATFARAAGNPFYTEELLADGAEDSGRMPESLREALALRLAGLGPGAREVVQLLSVGGSVSHALLARVSGMGEHALLLALREAVDRAILVPDPSRGRYGFRHPLIAEVAYAEMLPGERSRLHGAFARALEADPTLGDPSPARGAAELAQHWDEAGEAAKALPALVRAADEARRVHAQAEALAMLTRADAIAGVLPGADRLLAIPRWALSARLAVAAEAMGEFERALGWWRDAEERAAGESPPVRADLLVRHGETEFLAGHLDRFVAARRAALAVLPSDAEPRLRSLVLGKLAIALSLSAGLAEAKALAHEALDLARGAGARAEEGKAHSTLGTVLYLSGNSVEAIEHLRTALASNESLGRFGDEAIDRSNLSEALHLAGRTQAALDVLLAGLVRARAHGLERTYGETMRAVAVNWLFLLGRWDEAERLGREILDGQPEGVSADWAALALAELQIAQGRFDDAAANLDAAADGSRDARVTGWYGPQEQRAHLLVELHRPAEALAEIRRALAALDSAGWAPESGEIRWIVIRGLQAAIAASESARARHDETLAADARQLAAELVRRFDAHVVAVRALAGELDPHALTDAAYVAAERSRFDGVAAPELWREVADRFARMEHPWDEADTRWREAEALLLAGARRSEAAGPLRAAHATARRLGARPLLGRIEALAARARIALAPAELGGDPGRPGAIADLTPREREVLALVAAGLTNRQIARDLFISDKTASVHVTNIKEKLQVETRVEVAAIGIRLGLAK